ncbi:M23 family metallopeptidase [Flocculibacter collagenilyticus]|uniref:M23 family metallopeptidase n=1 Tax=Flocculibacter collagenilyticus TaxID=2744479 RepID=UPI0018F65802|nr:M23 family metallopeptidase [Flocculibacter collagenilyticus]
MLNQPLIHRALWLSIILSLFTFLIKPVFAIELSLSGDYTQGGLIIGKTDEGNTVTFNGQQLQMSAKGDFIFGFGRDDKLEHVLEITNSDKKSVKHMINIAKRDYKIQRIEGVAKKYVSPPPEVLSRIKQDNIQIANARAVRSDRLDFLSPMLKPVKGPISGVYGSQRYFNGEPKRPHYGLDIAAKTGTPVAAPLAGKVTLAHADMYYSGGTIIIDHGLGLTSTYIHLSAVDVMENQEIKQGQVIGKVGATGRVTGPHLDWRFNWLDKRLDPALLMN